MDAWRPRRGAGQLALVWLLPFRGFRCAGCGATVWGLAGSGVNLVRLAVWAVLAIALGWSAGRRVPEEGDRLREPAIGTRSTAASPPRSGPPASGLSPADGSNASELAVLIPLWAEAWTAGRAADYFAFYSREFAPEEGETRDVWLARERAALSAADRPPLRFRAFEVESLSADRARVRLDRDANGETRPATRGEPGETPGGTAATAGSALELELVRETGGWKIVRQRETG